MRKFDVRFCECGHIHLIPNEKIQNAIKDNKHFLFICAKCGKAVVIGADIEHDPYGDGETYYNMYSFDFSPYESKRITEEDFLSSKKQKGISEVFYSQGINVPMMNGYYASAYFNGRFFDDRLIDNLYLIDRKNITPEEVHAFICKAQQDAKTVNMNRFIRETEDEVLQEISEYDIESLDWSGTKYEKGKANE